MFKFIFSLIVLNFSILSILSAQSYKGLSNDGKKEIELIVSKDSKGNVTIKKHSKDSTKESKHSFASFINEGKWSYNPSEKENEGEFVLYPSSNYNYYYVNFDDEIITPISAKISGANDPIRNALVCNCNATSGGGTCQLLYVGTDKQGSATCTTYSCLSCGFGFATIGPERGRIFIYDRSVMIIEAKSIKFEK